MSRLPLAVVQTQSACHNIISAPSASTSLYFSFSHCLLFCWFPSSTLTEQCCSVTYSHCYTHTIALSQKPSELPTELAFSHHSHAPDAKASPEARHLNYTFF